jgi:hypothetical protein
VTCCRLSDTQSIAICLLLGQFYTWMPPRHLHAHFLRTADKYLHLCLAADVSAVRNKQSFNHCEARRASAHIGGIEFWFEVRNAFAQMLKIVA